MHGEYVRFHIYSKIKGKKKRTTISVESFLAHCMAIKLKQEPGTKEAHSAVRLFLQKEQDSEDGQLTSYYLKKRLYFEVLDKYISSKYWTLSSEKMLE